MNFITMLLQTIFALALVCGLAIVVFRYVLPKLQTMNAGRSMVRVVDRTALEARKSLYVVEVGGKWLLLATSEAGVHLLSELDAASAEEAAMQLERARHNKQTLPSSSSIIGGTFAEHLARIMNKKR